MVADKKTVLVVGGGFAGLTICNYLRNSYNVILLDPKTFFEYVPKSPHSLVSPETAGRLLVDYPPTGVTFKQGLLVAVTTDGTRGKATLQDGEEIEFDYACICTGSSYPGGVKSQGIVLQSRADRLKEFVDVRDKIHAANSVVVVGGGSVGVEIASEVAESFPGKKVSLVCAGGVLDRMDPKAQQFAADWLKQHGVEVLTGERISDWGGVGDGLPVAATLQTEKGTVIQGDVVFKCLGVRPATSLFKGSLGEEQLLPNGAVAVEPTLQVKGWRNVFAVGDCNSVQEEKTANLAGQAAVVAAQNLIKLDQGGELAKYPEDLFGGYPKLPMCGGTSLGTQQAVFQLGSDVQMGSTPAKLSGMIAWIWVRVAGGSRFWNWLFSQLKKTVTSGITAEARKAEQANAANATAASAGVPARAAA